ncbi:MAG: hypothetical protein V7K89_15450 [Nostoc sp.]|uniref:hypothetical protein n=1 Tax=Nostoc sp. TaxID=1180 RepID=UPI002FFADBB2
MNLFVMIPTGKCDRTVFKEWGVGKITSLVVPQVELPPLIPPWKGGKPENLVPSPLQGEG